MSRQTDEQRLPGRPPEYDEPMVSLQIHVPDSLKQALLARARTEGTSVTRIVTRVLQQHEGRW